MKYILTGSTGFVGSEVLAQLCRRSTVSSIVVLTRRPLPESTRADPKIQSIVMKDFNVYTDDVVEKIAGADACIWALGARAVVPEVEIDYPLALARAVLSTRAPGSKPFRYIYCSGMFAERDQSKSLWFSQRLRHIKGAAENSIIACADEHKGSWETYIAKPGMVIKPANDGLKQMLTSPMGNIRVDELAAAMIDIVANGNEEQTFLNADLVAKGREVLCD
ncbi:hypothetical protein FB45DRAFT_97536 [Roridomyces roridus]|uniref:NAD(P)-binding domain-containing protein n=1 Tax=Roridomyces roridus TaxID=1738132 RepID=A0AAD7BJS7_9AGAR|nr:hypothetical protein FB45DRAFT_97536 [Roridomyces roridus]